MSNGEGSLMRVLYARLPELPVGREVEIVRVGRIAGDMWFVVASDRVYRVRPESWGRVSCMASRVELKRALTFEDTFPKRVFVDKDMRFLDRIAPLDDLPPFL